MEVSQGIPTPDMVLIETLTLTGVSTITSSAISSTYRAVLIHYEVVNDAAGNQQLAFRFNADGGNNYDYQRCSGASVGSDVNQAALRISGNTTQTNGCTGFALISLAAKGADNQHGVWCGTGTYSSAGTVYGNYHAANRISTITLQDNSGLAMTGTMKIYGIK